MTIGDMWQTNSVASIGEALGLEIFRIAMEMVDQIAPERPVGTEDNDPVDQWAILERTAMKMPLALWANDPIVGADLLSDLWHLRQQFLGKDHPSIARLQALEKLGRKRQQTLPDPRVVRGTPEFEKQQRRLRRA